MRALFLAVSLVCVAPLAAQGDDAFVDLTYSAALDRAKAEHKVVLIDFFTTWCGPCRQLDKTTWRDANVVKWLKEHAVALRIDAEQNTDLARDHKVEAYPTIVLLRPDESEIDRFVGYRSPVAFLADAQSALAGKDGAARAREKLVATGATDFQARMDLGDALAQRGKYAEALEHYLWCFDRGLDHDPAFVGVRLSFLLADIASLGEKYPPARRALVERRDAAEKHVRSDADLDAVYDMTSIDRYLGEAAHTVEMYEYARDEKKLPRVHPVRQRLFEASLEQLLEARRYDEIAREVDDPLPRLRQLVAQYEQMSGMVPLGDMAAEVRSRQLIKPALHLFEAEVGAHRGEVAEALATALLDAVDAHGEIWAGLITRARRAGDEELARKLGERALAAVSAAEQEMVRQVLRAPARGESGAHPGAKKQ